jgi:hypothetical protein
MTIVDPLPGHYAVGTSKAHIDVNFQKRVLCRTNPTKIPTFSVGGAMRSLGSQESQQQGGHGYGICIEE